MGLDLAACRSLLRLCRRLDENPVELLGVIGSPPRRFHPGLRKVVQIPRGQWPLVDEAVGEICGGFTEYCHPMAGSATAASRRHWRLLTALGMQRAGSVRELRRRLQASYEVVRGVSESRQQGWAGAASSGSSGAFYKELLGFRELVRLGPQSKEPVMVGDFLLAHPLSCLFQPDLDQGVFLISEVHQNAGYVRGLVVNKPEGLSVRAVISKGPRAEEDIAVAEKLGMAPLLETPLFAGGDLVPNTNSALDQVQWLHTLGPKLPGSREVAPSVWTGGDLQLAGDLVQCGKADLSNFRALRGFAGWATQQLALELERGVWARVRAPEAEVEVAQKLCMPTAEDSDSLWQTLAQHVGLSAFAKLPRGAEIDNRLRAYVEQNERAQMEDIVRGAEKSGTAGT